MTAKGRASGFPHLEFSTRDGALITNLRVTPKSPEIIKVTVEVDGGNSCQLFVSDEFAYRFKLVENRLLTPSEAAELWKEATNARARQLAMDAIARRSRSRTEIETKLIRKGTPSPVARATCESLERLGLIDDERFAREFARSRVATRGASVWLIRRDLARKGVAREVADAAIDTVLDDSGLDETDIARRQAEKKWRSLSRLEPLVARRRLAGFLKRRGFSGDTVRAVVRDVSTGAGSNS